MHSMRLATCLTIGLFMLAAITVVYVLTAARVKENREKVGRPATPAQQVNRPEQSEGIPMVGASPVISSASNHGRGNAPRSSPLFQPWTDPSSGVKSFVLSQRVAPLQQSFYFTNPSFSDPWRGRFAGISGSLFSREPVSRRLTVRG
jgi:hypothetical protein